MVSTLGERSFLRLLPRKEVIQPHLPVRLPCYDFTPVTNPALGRCLQKVSSRTSGVVDFHGVTGGVYKTRERIQRKRADLRLTSDSDFMCSSCRVQSELRPGLRDLLLSRVCRSLYRPCNTCVAQNVGA